MAATIGIMVFNSGETEIQRIGDMFGLLPGENSRKHAVRKDTKRMKRVVVTSGQRKDRKHRHIQERQRQIQKEGVTYAAGRFGV